MAEAQVTISNAARPKKKVKKRQRDELGRTQIRLILKRKKLKAPEQWAKLEDSLRFPRLIGNEIAWITPSSDT